MFSHTKSQLFDALFQFLPSGGVDGCKSHINIVLIVVIFSFWRKYMQPKSLFSDLMKSREITGTCRQMYK